MKWRQAHNRRRAADRRYQANLARAKVKARYGKVYGMGIAKLHGVFKEHGVSAKDAEEAICSLGRLFSQVQKLIRKEAEERMKQSQLRNKS